MVVAAQRAAVEEAATADYLVATARRAGLRADAAEIEDLEAGVGSIPAAHDRRAQITPGEVVCTEQMSTVNHINYRSTRVQQLGIGVF